MPGFFKRPCAATCNQSHEITVDGVQMQPWTAIRRDNLRLLRKELRRVIFLSALIEIIRVGPVQIVLAGKEGYPYPPPGPEDYGFSYNVGHFLGWIYCSLFMIVYVPLFSWWVPQSGPQDAEEPSTIAKLGVLLKDLDLLILPMAVGICLGHFICHLACTVIYVDNREVDSGRFPKNTRKNWFARLSLLLGVLVVLTLGSGALHILEMTELARVQRLEYFTILVPIQIIWGLALGSVVQYKVEARNERKRLAAKAVETEAAVYLDEKQNLLDE